MPPVEVVFYKEDDGSVPVRDWLDGMSKKAAIKCLARLKRLEDLGHELRRPEADYLRDDIYELRVGLQGVNPPVAKTGVARRLQGLSGGANQRFGRLFQECTGGEILRAPVERLFGPTSNAQAVVQAPGFCNSRVNYRMLYFFHGRTIAVLSHGLVKEQAVPPREINLAVERKTKFEKAPRAHTE